MRNLKYSYHKRNMNRTLLKMKHQHLAPKILDQKINIQL